MRWRDFVVAFGRSRAALGVALAGVVGAMVAGMLPLSGVLAPMESMAQGLVRPWSTAASARHEAVVVGLGTGEDFAAVPDLLRVVRASSARGIVLLSPLADGVPAGLVERHGVVDAVHCAEGEAATALGRALASLGRSCSGDVSVRPTRTPVPVLHVGAIVRGEIPMVAFEGRFVVVGPTFPELDAWTSGGLAPPAVIVAQALHAELTGQTPLRIPLALEILAGALLGGLAAFLAASRVPLRIVLSLVLAVVVIDLGLLALGVSAGLFRHLAVLVAGAATAVGVEWLALARRLSRVIRELVAAEAGLPPPHADAWHRGLEMLVERLGARGAIGLELPAGSHHVVIRATARFDTSTLREPRRDVRRPPYRQASLGSTRVDRFVDGGPALLVPVRVEAELLGFVVLGFASAEEVEASTGPAVEFVAQIAPSLLGVRLAEAAAQPVTLDSLTERVEVVARTSVRAVHALNEARERLETNPWPSLIAAPWGAVRHCNRAMVELLGQHGLRDPESLQAVLVAVTESGHEDVARWLEQARAEGTAAVPGDFALAWTPGSPRAGGAFVLYALPAASDGGRERTHSPAAPAPIPIRTALRSGVVPRGPELRRIADREE